MDINEARSDHLTSHIDNPCGTFSPKPFARHLCNLATDDRDIGLKAI
jgi:hypothetical protein